MRVLRAEKKHACARGTLLCVGPVETVNVVRGCAARCAFCYARCYRGAPEPGTVLLYDGLGALLRHDLDAPRRKRPLPEYVVLGSAGDAFLGGPEVLQVTRECIEILLRRGIGITFSTRGVIPADVISQLARQPKLIRATIAIPSISDDYNHTWEPGTASPHDRLFLWQKLKEAGIDPHIRIDPVIPLVNDSSEDMHALASTLAGVGVDRAMLSFLQLRRGVAEQLHREIPHELLRIMLACFPSLQETGHAAEFDHIEDRQAAAGLHRIQAIGKQHGVAIEACRCHNPGLPAAHCPITPEETRPPAWQEELFPDL